MTGRKAGTPALWTVFEAASAVLLVGAAAVGHQPEGFNDDTRVDQRFESEEAGFFESFPVCGRVCQIKCRADRN